MSFVATNEEKFGSIQDLCFPLGTRSRPGEIDRASLNILDKVDEDDFITVFKAVFHSVPGLPSYIVTVKSLVMQESAMISRKQHLLQEAALLVGLEHRHVIKLIGVVTMSDPNLLVLEYCEYGTLMAFIMRSDLSLAHESRAAADVADGMAYLATNRIVHRDLAACNVSVDSERRCKVMLSGLSRFIGEQGQIKLLGDPIAIRWAPPEVLREQLFSEQSDVWSFGVPMYEIWTRGDVPFGDMIGSQIREDVIKGVRPTMPYRCPPELKKVLTECWQDCGARPSFAKLCLFLRELETKAPNDAELLNFEDIRVDEI